MTNIRSKLITLGNGMEWYSDAGPDETCSKFSSVNAIVTKRCRQGDNHWPLQWCLLHRRKAKHLKVTEYMWSNRWNIVFFYRYYTLINKHTTVHIIIQKRGTVLTDVTKSISTSASNWSNRLIIKTNLLVLGASYLKTFCLICAWLIRWVW